MRACGPQVSGTPTLGDDSLGKRGYDRVDLSVEPHKVLNGKTGADTSGFFYPREGDRVVGFNYVSFRIPPNWLDIDPPTVSDLSGYYTCLVASRLPTRLFVGGHVIRSQRAWPLPW